jgi:hypothetical protein
MRTTTGLVGPSTRLARVIINSPCWACAATLLRNGWAGSALVTRLRGRASSIAVPHMGQLIRHPSIQLRSLAPRVTCSTQWRLMQHLHTCIGRTVAISSIG